jgi:hypothetical protein
MQIATIQECSSQAERKLSHLSLFTLLFALFFWVWAVINTFRVSERGFIDTGVFSFFSVILSSAYVYHITTSDQTSKLGSCVARTLVKLSHAFVVSTYILGIIVGFTFSFLYVFYCSIFVVIWTVIMIVTSHLMKSSIIAISSNDNEEIENGTAPELELPEAHDVL